MRDALVLVDVLQTFGHRSGEALLASFRGRLDAMRTTVERCRAAGVPVVYVNDMEGRWDADGPALVRAALAGPGGDVIREVAPAEGDALVLKPRYSAFDHTALVLLLRDRDVERLLLAGAATEMCVVQTAIDARELGFKVTIVRDACATADEEMERLAFRYAEEVVGVRLAGADELRPGQDDQSSNRSA